MLKLLTLSFAVCFVLAQNENFIRNNLNKLENEVAQMKLDIKQLVNNAEETIGNGGPLLLIALAPLEGQIVNVESEVKKLLKKGSKVNLKKNLASLKQKINAVDVNAGILMSKVRLALPVAERYLKNVITKVEGQGKEILNGAKKMLKIVRQGLGKEDTELNEKLNVIESQINKVDTHATRIMDGIKTVTVNGGHFVKEGLNWLEGEGKKVINLARRLLKEAQSKGEGYMRSELKKLKDQLDGIILEVMETARLTKLNIKNQVMYLVDYELKDLESEVTQVENSVKNLMKETFEE